MITATQESQSDMSAEPMNAMDFLIHAIQKCQSADDPESESITLTENPDQADLIIFAESHKNAPKIEDIATRVLRHRIYQRYRSKSIIHNAKDTPNPILPGLYTSLHHKWTTRLGCVGTPYLANLNPYLDKSHKDIGFDGTIKHLASFIGSSTHKPIRKRLITNAQSAPHGSLWNTIEAIDTADAFVGTLRAYDLRGHNELKELFVRRLLQAKFALCPRGAGLSSYRIFEAMQAARPPVIIADGWSPPPGPDWDAFAIRIPESQLAHLPSLLKEYESDWQDMGQLAHQVWQAHYSPSRLGGEIIRLARHVLDLQAAHKNRHRLYTNIYQLGPRQITAFEAKQARKSG